MGSVLVAVPMIGDRYQYLSVTPGDFFGDRGTGRRVSPRREHAHREAGRRWRGGWVRLGAVGRHAEHTEDAFRWGAHRGDLARGRVLRSYPFSGTATTATDDARLPADPARQGSHGNQLEEVEDQPHHGDHLGDEDEDHDDQDRSDAQADWALSGKS